MFYLEVKMAAEPVVESWLVDVTRGLELHGYPVVFSIKVDIHGNMVHLRRPYKPVTLQKSNSNIKEHNKTKYNT